MNRNLPWVLVLLLSFTSVWGSRRGQEPRAQIDLERREVFTGEAYGADVNALADGFVYLYAVDGEGYVSLLYPLLSEDGRGQVGAGDTISLSPLYAGAVAGIEQLVAVHTREFRPIRASRHHFLAPDPGDLTDINARLTRSERELDNYATASLSVLATSVPQELVVDDEEADENVHVGVTIRHHNYDYWCSFCDCWHPACTHNHCWCGWETVDHYYGHYHYGHCFLWSSWHPWWRPPVIYVYVRGGSPWDYDTRPWRPRQVWGSQRHFSDRWRQSEIPRMSDPGSWIEPRQRGADDQPEWVGIKQRLEPKQNPDRPDLLTPSVLSTKGSAGEATPSNDKASPRQLRTHGPETAPNLQLKPKPTVPDRKSGSTDGKATSKKKSKKPPAEPKESKKQEKPAPQDVKPENAPAKPEPSKPVTPKKPDPGRMNRH